MSAVCVIVFGCVCVSDSMLMCVRRNPLCVRVFFVSFWVVETTFVRFRGQCHVIINHPDALCDCYVTVVFVFVFVGVCL